jgi:RimJ/RimL family protein N-acetyltransferase
MILRPPAREVLGGLALERWQTEDELALFEAIAQSIDHLRPWMVFAADHTHESVARFLSDSEEGWRQGSRFEYALRNPRREILGSAGLMGRIGPGGLEIGYWIHAAHTRRGVALLAAALLSEMALALDTVDHVEIHHDQANLASGAVPARLGFGELGSFAAERRAPADIGRDIRWRMDGEDFAGSPAAALLQEARLSPRPGGA